MTCSYYRILDLMLSDVQSFIPLVHHDHARLSSELNILQRHVECGTLVAIRRSSSLQDLCKFVLGLLLDELFYSPALGRLVKHALVHASFTEFALSKPKLFLDLIAGALAHVVRR